MSTTLPSRSMGLRRTLLAIGAAAGLAVSAHAAPAPSYRFVELSVGGGEYAMGWASAINNAGQALGGYGDASSTTVMVWTETSATELRYYGTGSAINDLGAIVGYNSNRRGDQAIYHDESIDHNLSTPGTVYDEGYARSINGSGQIAGGGSINGTWYAMMWESHNADATILPSVDPLVDVESLGGTASAINDAGRVVGQSKMANGKGRATLWTNGVPTDLGVLHPGDDSAAHDINNAGQIIGTSGEQPVLWENGTITALGLLDGTVLGVVSDINNLGQIVGTSYKDGKGVATLWDGQSVIDLNQFLEGSEWVLDHGSGINDQGWIVGSAHRLGSDVFRPFMLIPSSVPEPSRVVLSLLGCGALALAWRRKRATPV